jgi:hypothetical protein
MYLSLDIVKVIKTDMWYIVHMKAMKIRREFEWNS